MTNDEGAGIVSAPSRVAGEPTRREVWLRRRRRRSALIAIGSTIVTLGVVTVVVTSSSGWGKVKTVFFNGDRFKKDFPDVLGFLWVDIKLFLQTAPFILLWGLVIALCRNSRNPALFPLRAFAAIYTDFFRGVPIILTIYLVQNQLIRQLVSSAPPGMPNVFLIDIICSAPEFIARRTMPGSCDSAMISS